MRPKGLPMDFACLFKTYTSCKNDIQTGHTIMRIHTVIIIFQVSWIPQSSLRRCLAKSRYPISQ
ncbi:hypothetical protein BX666DRAFT_1916308 [Dichotomocladium elegans]|nr:hypothetical protein BX666DRAFT_1916308 [Dichotomocladium elegans]